MIRVGIAGGAGMLGSMLVRYFAAQPDIALLATVQNEAQYKLMSGRFPKVHWEIAYLDEQQTSFHFNCLSKCDWIINAIGIIQPYLKEHNPKNYQRAILLNAFLPYHLSDIASKKDTRILQIATDGVFSSNRGVCTENDIHDENGIYAKSKSIGECPFSNFFNLRCSIVGPEYDTALSLLEWFRHQKKGAEIKGFSNHRWNGIGTLQFAKICHGIIRENISLPNVQHIVPSDFVTKASLLKLFARYYKREDITIIEALAQQTVDRIIGTSQQVTNIHLWQAAGYTQPPCIEKMIEELSKWS